MRLVLGQKVELSRMFVQQDYDRFAALTGDNNPIHVDPEFAATTRFQRTLAHGMLLFSTLNGAISHTFGGACVELGDVELMFPGPTYTGEQMRIVLEVVGISADGGSVELTAMISRPDGAPSCTARAKVSLS